MNLPMPPRPLDGRLRYGPPKSPGVCRVRLYQLGLDRPAVVILTDLDSNTGPTISQGLEELAAIVSREHGLDWECVLWVEHYPQWLDVAATWSAIAFHRGTSGELERPEARAITRHALQHLVGQVLVD